jgi:hypothetical protein
VASELEGPIGEKPMNDSGCHPAWKGKVRPRPKKINSPHHHQNPTLDFLLARATALTYSTGNDCDSLN